MDYYDLPNNKAFLVSTKGIIINNQGQILLLKICDKDYNEKVREKWDIPGGLIEVDENTSQALVREIKEECGLNIEIGKLLAINDVSVEGFKFKNGDVKNVRIFVLGFFCKYQCGNIKLSEEHEDYKWVNVDDISTWDLIPNARGLIEKALRNLEDIK